MRNIHELWYFGRKDKNIRPFKNIESRHFYGDRKQIMKSISQARAAIEKVDAHIKTINSSYWTLTFGERDAIWKLAMVQLTNELDPLLLNRKRKVCLENMQYCSIYDNYLIKRKSRVSCSSSAAPTTIICHEIYVYIITNTFLYCITITI